MEAPVRHADRLRQFKQADRPAVDYILRQQSAALRQTEMCIRDRSGILADMAMGDGDRQRIRRIRLRIGRQLEQGAHHVLDLTLFSAANADNRLLNLAGGVFKHR